MIRGRFPWCWTPTFFYEQISGNPFGSTGNIMIPGIIGIDFNSLLSVFSGCREVIFYIGCSRY